MTLYFSSIRRIHGMEIFLCISRDNSFDLNFLRMNVDDYVTKLNITLSWVMFCIAVVLILFYIDVSLMMRLNTL